MDAQEAMVRSIDKLESRLDRIEAAIKAHGRELKRQMLDIEDLEAWNGPQVWEKEMELNWKLPEKVEPTDRELKNLNDFFDKGLSKEEK